MAGVADLTDARRLHRSWVASIAWTAVGITVALILSASNGLPLRFALPGSLLWYYLLGIFVWIACAVDARFNIWRRPRAVRLLVHAAAGVLALGVWVILTIAAARLAIGPGYWRAVFGGWWMFQLMSNAMVYAAGVGIGLAVRASDRERQREQRQTQLEVLARDAKLTAIKAQLQPHFLFNALNSILALIEHDPAEAKLMLTRLASLLHSVFDRLDEPFVPLERELEIISDYLDIERIRFGERMAFSIQADDQARQSRVPPFLLQPIVENAVKHGIEPYPQPGTVRITGSLHGGRLRLCVADTGPGVNGHRPAGQGRGLTLTRQRLQSVYGPDAAMLRSERRTDGFVVMLDLPARSDVI